jgi:hypothetical protein
MFRFNRTLCLAPSFGCDPNHHVDVFLLQVFDSESGLLSFRVGFPAESSRDMDVLLCPVFQVITVLTEVGQPPPLSVTLGTQVPEPVVVCSDSKGQWE